MPDTPAPTPSPPLSTKPPSPSLTTHTPSSTRRIEIWRHEVASATLEHPTPPLPAPQSPWRRLERRLRGKIWAGNGAGNGAGKGVVGEKEEEAAEQTRMYELTGREAVRVDAKAEEWSWDVEGGRETESTGDRKGEEKRARLERAAELLVRQEKMEGGGEVGGLAERRVLV